jgi:hypothetical protein
MSLILPIVLNEGCAHIEQDGAKSRLSAIIAYFAIADTQNLDEVSLFHSFPF